MLSHHVRSITALVVGALALFAASASAKPAASIACGQVLTHSVTLRADLSDCPGNGLVVGAAGITVDLNGHTVDGVPKSGCDFDPGRSTAGISIEPGYDGVTVRDGTVQQFDTGVFAGAPTDGAAGDTLRRLVLRENRSGGVQLLGGQGGAAVGNRVEQDVVSGSPCGAGVQVTVGQANRFAHNRIENVKTGVTVCCSGASSGNVVADNQITATSEIGVLVFDSEGTVVDDNVLRDIGDDGILLNGANAHTVVTDNTLTRVQFAGIAVFKCTDGCADTPGVPTDIRITGNDLAATGDGILLNDTDDDVVRRNAVSGAGTFGPPSFGLGIILNGVSDTVVDANRITGSGRSPAPGLPVGPGILVGIPAEFGPSRPVTGNAVTRNTVVGQATDGIRIEMRAQDTTVERNVAHRNAGDGISILSVATTLRRNRADDNAAYGIEAVPGVTDGGGNRASGNGAAAQCTGVACGDGGAPLAGSSDRATTGR